VGTYMSGLKDIGQKHPFLTLLGPALLDLEPWRPKPWPDVSQKGSQKGVWEAEYTFEHPF